MRYILYGASKYMRDSVNQEKMQLVDYIVDRSEKLIGTKYFDKEIKSPDVLLEEDKDTIFIVIAAYGQLYSIEYDLMQMGFEKGRHFEWLGRLPNYYPQHTGWYRQKSENWKQDETAWRRSFSNWVPHERAELVAKMIDWKEVKSVLDLGSGSEPMCPLLPHGVDYYPVDYKQLTGNTMVFDFNQKQFPDIKADVVLLIGVHGYVDYEMWLIDQAVRAVKQGGQLIISLNYASGNCSALDLIIKYQDLIKLVDYAFRSAYYGIFRFRKRNETISISDLKEQMDDNEA